MAPGLADLLPSRTRGLVIDFCSFAMLVFAVKINCQKTLETRTGGAMKQFVAWAITMMALVVGVREAIFFSGAIPKDTVLSASAALVSVVVLAVLAVLAVRAALVLAVLTALVLGAVTTTSALAVTVLVANLVFSLVIAATTFTYKHKASYWWVRIIILLATGGVVAGILLAWWWVLPAAGLMVLFGWVWRPRRDHASFAVAG